MPSKKIDLLQYLVNKKTAVTSAELQEVLHVSRRSIINYVNDINHECDDLITSSQNGYQIINLTRAYTQIHQDESLGEFGYEKRKKELLYRMILGNEKIDIDEAAESLYISTATLQSDLLKLKHELKSENLSIKTKNNCLFLIGSSIAKRKYIMSLLNDEIEQNYFNLESFQNLFHFANVKQIRQIVVNSLEINDFFLDDYSLLNYILHLSVLMETVIQAPDITELDDRNNNVVYAPRIMEIVQGIHHQLTKLYHMELPFEKILSVSLLMSTRIVSKDYDKLTYNQISDILGEEAIALVNTIIFNINRIYGVNLKEDNFMVRFAFHICNLLTRARNNIILPKNQFITMQDDYPFLYFIAKYIGSIIHDEAKVDFNETEISYIALHLGVLMEEKQSYTKNINCAIVIYDYYNSGKLLFQKLSSEINGLYLMSIVNSYTQLHSPDNIDLIITTLPINPSIDIPSIKINMIPTQNDYTILNDKINKLRNRLSTKELEKKIRKFFKKELFCVANELKNRDEAIKQICNQMEQLKYVNHDFMQTIYFREEIASSAYYNIALPHPINTDDKNINESSIATMISQTSIQWEDSNVNFIFLIALKKDDRTIFKEVFDMLTTVLNHKQIKQQLFHCKDYEHFVNIMIHANNFL